MKAKLKRLYSADYDLSSFYPESETNFILYLQAFIGPEDEDSSDAFNIAICTPEWLSEHNKYEEVIFGRGYIIVREYDLMVIKTEITKFCENCLGENWVEVAQKVSRIGIWEFEEYKHK